MKNVVIAQKAKLDVIAQVSWPPLRLTSLPGLWDCQTGNPWARVSYLGAQSVIRAARGHFWLIHRLLNSPVLFLQMHYWFHKQIIKISKIKYCCKNKIITDAHSQAAKYVSPANEQDSVHPKLIRNCTCLMNIAVQVFPWTPAVHNSCSSSHYLKYPLCKDINLRSQFDGAQSH